MYNHRTEQSARSTSRLYISADSSALLASFLHTAPAAASHCCSSNCCLSHHRLMSLSNCNQYRNTLRGLYCAHPPNNINVRYTRSCDVMCCPGTAHNSYGCLQAAEMHRQVVQVRPDCKNINITCCLFFRFTVVTSLIIA